MRHLRESGQLTAGLILRALLSGNVVLFEEALAELSGLPLARVSGLVHDTQRRRLARALRQGRAAGRRPIRRSVRRSRRCARRLRRRAGRRGAAQAPHGRARADAVRGRTRSATIEPLLTLLRRFATEAAREEARLFCDELVADDARCAATRRRATQLAAYAQSDRRGHARLMRVLRAARATARRAASR